MPFIYLLLCKLMLQKNTDLETGEVTDYEENTESKRGRDRTDFSCIPELCKNKDSAE